MEAAVAVLEQDTLSRPAYLRALRKLQMQGIASMEEILWLRARIVLCTPVYLQAVSAKLAAGASVCGLHDEVGTAADWEMGRWAAFPQLDAPFWLGDKYQCKPPTHRMARMSLFEEVVGQRFFLGTPSTVATPSLRVRGQAFILVAWCRLALRSSAAATREFAPLVHL